MEELTSIEQIDKLHSEKKLIGLFVIDNNLYHECVGISKSAIGPLNKSIKHWQKYVKDGHKASEAKTIGSILHCLTLEKDKFDDYFLKSPDCYRRSKVEKEIWATFNEKLTTTQKDAYTEKMLITAENMYKSLMESPNNKKLLRGIYEIACFWVDPDTGVLCKCKFDVIGTTSGLATDLKKTQDASEVEFIRSVYKFTYHVQEAFYLDGIREAIKQSGIVPDFKLPKKMVFVAVEEEEPHFTNRLTIPEDFVENGREKYKMALKRYAEFLQTQKAVAYTEEVKEMRPQAWMYR